MASADHGALAQPIRYLRITLLLSHKPSHNHIDPAAPAPLIKGRVVASVQREQLIGLVELQNAIWRMLHPPSLPPTEFGRNL
jgi:hypothetical protein